MTLRKIALSLGMMALFMSAAPMAMAQTTTPPAAPAAADPNTIIVTAMRRATNIQKTAVQVSALSAVKLKDAAVNQLNDVTYLAGC